MQLMPTASHWYTKEQCRDYGRWVRITLTAHALHLTIDAGNPLNLRYDATLHRMPSTARSADALGMALAGLLDLADAMMRG